MALSVVLEKRCPKLSDFPDIDLYMDQVISVLNQMLSPFFREETCITSTMINNYVKQKLIPPPENKRYKKHQLTRLFMICVLKSFLQLSDVHSLLETLGKNRTEDELFGIFARKFDASMDHVFQDLPEGKPASDAACRTLSAALNTFASLIYTRMLFDQIPKTLPEAASKAKKEEEKEKEKQEKKERKAKEKQEKEKKKAEKSLSE